MAVVAWEAGESAAEEREAAWAAARVAVKEEERAAEGTDSQ